MTIFYSLRFETCIVVTSFDSQGYGGGIRSHLLTRFSTTRFRGVFTEPLRSKWRDMDHIENIVLFFLRAWVLRALPSNCRCLQNRSFATGLHATIHLFFETYPIKQLSGRNKCHVIIGVIFREFCMKLKTNWSHMNNWLRSAYIRGLRIKFRNW
jgi:hypothetical protein